MINVAIVEDHKLVGSLLQSQLKMLSNFEQVYYYNSARKFLSVYKSIKFDLLIVDLILPDIQGQAIIEEVRTQLKDTVKIIVLSSVIDPDIIKETIKLGANAYLSKDSELSEFEIAVQAIFVENGIYIGNSVKDYLIQRSFSTKAQITLTENEQKVLELLCKGRSVKEISQSIHLSVNTIQAYVKRLFSKFDVNRTVDLILKAIKEQVVFI